MRSARKSFVLRFLAFGFAFSFITRLVLSQPPDALGAAPNQQSWQRAISSVLWPIKLVLIGPINWLQQDPDPPPPFRVILCAVYWTLLALGIHWLWARRTPRS